MFDPQILNKTLAWCQTAVPKPTPRNEQTALGVHFEEVAEMVSALKGNDRLTQSLLTAALVSLHSLALHLKASEVNKISVVDTTELLDALADQIVTAVGVADMNRYDILGAVDEVNRSNWSKFVDGQAIFDANQKIVKGPHYSKPNLRQFVPH